MKVKLSALWLTCLAPVIAICMAFPALAQDDPFGINGDVDNDGVVGPTDIQQVINGALGLDDRGPDAVNRDVRQYIVASPRASLALRPGAAPDSTEPCTVIGAATNFQRQNGRLLVRAGKEIVFRYDRNAEGVWHDGACGLIRTELALHMRPIDPEAEPTPVPPDDPSWEPIGHDVAHLRICGPLVAPGRVGVRHLFETPGDYVVRSTIRTHAIPEDEIVPEGETPHFCGAARDVDAVFTHVRVLDHDPTEEDLNWEAENDPGTVGSRFGDRLQDGEDGGVALP